MRRADGGPIPRTRGLPPQELFIMHEADTDRYRRDRSSYTQIDVPWNPSLDPAFMADARSRGYEVSVRDYRSYV